MKNLTYSDRQKTRQRERGRGEENGEMARGERERGKRNGSTNIRLIILNTKISK